MPLTDKQKDKLDSVFNISAETQWFYQLVISNRDFEYLFIFIKP